jgi:hypothetical protein
MTKIYKKLELLTWSSSEMAYLGFIQIRNSCTKQEFLIYYDGREAGLA